MGGLQVYMQGRPYTGHAWTAQTHVSMLTCRSSDRCIMSYIGPTMSGAIGA